ncbi:hypothetical protein [Leisingera sp. McT4-56]|uniref:hypothetical protein n=1 Tax=Leisingera sp. McT4-56 TaxID=2881255 RepID=UPI001CF82C79|nr:hypothetical protein [Leisingera sp. McT4-56]MCB4455826.1 hypothetical protein [Leisingera sp. McT4-56]
MAWLRGMELVEPTVDLASPWACRVFIRRLIYTTDEIDRTFPLESLIIRQCGRPRGEAWRVGWKRSVHEWHAVKSQLGIMLEARFQLA